MSIKWSDSKNWWMDLLKSFITYFLITLFSILIFNFCINKKDHKWQIEFDLKVEALKDYERTSSLYNKVVYDAIGDAYYGHNKNTSKAISEFYDNKFDEMAVSKEGLRYWFHVNQDDKLDTLINSVDTIRKWYKSMVDSFCNESVLKRFNSINGITQNKCQEGYFDKQIKLYWKQQTEEDCKKKYEEYIRTDKEIFNACKEILENN